MDDNLRESNALLKLQSDFQAVKDERDRLLQERDALLHERDKLLQEIDALLGRLKQISVTTIPVKPDERLWVPGDDPILR